MSSHHPLLSLVLMLLATPMFSQGNGPAPASLRGNSESYGPGANFLVIPSTSFGPQSSDTLYSIDGNGYLFRSGSGGGTSYFAPVDLPAGASVVNVCGFTYDNSATASAEFSWIAWERGDATANAVAAVLNTASTGIAATPGFDQTCVSLTTPTLIRKFDDINGDGHPHYVSYMVRFSTTAANSSVEFGGAVITWLRTVSPAPAAATFADVPTNFLYFRAIEALAASGITAGCGGGNFCPNGTVTRGEMSAFLARALGLHWPL